MVNPIIFAFLASVAYIASVILLQRKHPLKRYLLVVLMGAALTAHFGLVMTALQDVMSDVSALNVLTLVAFGMAVIGAVIFFTKADSIAFTVVALIASVCIWLPLMVPNTMTKVHGWSLKIHIVLSISAYIAIAFAALYALLLLIKSYRLRKGKNVFSLALPMNYIENTMMRFAIIGEVLLTLSLVTGVFFIYDIWAQHVVHKLTFGFIAWLIILALLWRHYRQGFRGNHAAIWLLSGFIFLVLAYFGSAFVLQFILN